MVRELNNDNFDKFLNDNNVCLIDFHADWCEPCKKLMPNLEKIANKIPIGTIDVGEHQALARKFKVMSVPTLIIFSKTEQVLRENGYLDLEDLEDIISEYI